jgi:fructokinase
VSPTPLFAIIGEALMDIVDEGRHTSYRAHVGGSPLNVAAGLAQLGQPTALLARFSTDPFGRILRGYADRSGADLSLAVDSNAPTTLAVVQLDDEGVASYKFFVDGTADWGWTDTELADLPASLRYVHFGSLASWTPPGCDAIARRLARLRTDRTIIVTYDPNVRPDLLGERHHGVARVEASIALAHLAKASTEDLAWLYPSLEPGTVARRWLQLGPDIVIITDGANGPTAYTATGSVSRPAMRAEVVDTVGAGDAFMSGLLDGLGRARVSSTHDLAGSPTRLGSLLDDASVVAAIVCGRAGAEPPSRAEVDAFKRR